MFALNLPVINTFPDAPYLEFRPPSPGGLTRPSSVSSEPTVVKTPAELRRSYDSSLESVWNSISDSPFINHFLAEERQRDPNLAADQLRPIAKAELKKMHASYSPWVVDILKPVMDFGFRRGIAPLGASCDPADIRRIDEMLAERKFVVFGCAHESMADFLIKFLHMDAHYIGGNNLPSAIGYCGAIRIPRENDSQKIECRAYRAALRAYMEHLSLNGFPLVVYFEGERQREGKIKKLKPGIAEDIAHVCLQGTHFDTAHIVPCSVDSTFVTWPPLGEKRAVPGPWTIASSIHNMFFSAEHIGNEMALRFHFQETVQLPRALDVPNRDFVGVELRGGRLKETASPAMQQGAFAMEYLYGALLLTKEVPTFSLVATGLVRQGLNQFASTLAQVLQTMSMTWEVTRDEAQRAALEDLTGLRLLGVSANDYEAATLKVAELLAKVASSTLDIAWEEPLQLLQRSLTRVDMVDAAEIAEDIRNILERAERRVAKGNINQSVELGELRQYVVQHTEHIEVLRPKTLAYYARKVEQQEHAIGC